MSEVQMWLTTLLVTLAMLAAIASHYVMTL
jgi:hypothetical protein